MRAESLRRRFRAVSELKALVSRVTTTFEIGESSISVTVLATAVAVFASACSAESGVQMDAIDSSGYPMRLTLSGGLPDTETRFGLVACSPGEADGRLEFSPGHETQATSTLNFCFGEQNSAGYGPEAKLQRSENSVQVCRAREDGFCDGRDCTTLIFFDICADFTLYP